LIGRRWHLSVLDVRSLRRVDSDTDHYLVVAKVRERLAVSKRAMQKFDIKRFSLKTVNKMITNSIRLKSQLGPQLLET
jgi:hypothetical protein